MLKKILKIVSFDQIEKTMKIFSKKVVYNEKKSIVKNAYKKIIKTLDLYFNLV